MSINNLNYNDMEATKITKSEFSRLLLDNNSILLGAVNNISRDPHEVILCGVQNLKINNLGARRTVTAVKSSYIVFSDGSKLSTAANGNEVTYYKLGENVIYQLRKIDYSKDSQCNYNNIVYCFVAYYLD